MNFEDNIPMPPRPGRDGPSQSDAIRAMRPRQSVFIPTKEEANVFRALAHKALGPGKVSVQQVEGGWRAWRL